jgi:hypothetical protein
MKADCLTLHCSRWVILIATILLGFGFLSCTRNRASVPEAEYATKIVGSWQGTVGDEKETVSILGDGTFECQTHSTGFIATTLSQGVTGTIRGTWKITGTNILLHITGAENERVGNSTASSTIMSFNEGTLVLKSDRGGTSSFHRVVPL